jgi:hypothetical protein
VWILNGLERIEKNEGNYEMRNYKLFLHILGLILFFFINSTFAQNPLIMDQFTADPTTREFEGKIYIYPSHDILAGEGRGRTGWFCMEDYHVFSSENLTDWKDHGVIVSQNNVPWVDSTTYSMWAPDCIYRNGKYFFYYPARTKEKDMRRGMSIGVAISDKPYGPFKPEQKPIEGAFGIDPNIFIDNDGQAYMYWAARGLCVAKLKENMLELATEPQLIKDLPEGFKEGPFVFERKGIYYLTFPFVIDSTESLAYCTGDNPMGPFKYAGVIMDKSPTGCWTNHHSIVEYKGQWYLFYHHNDLSPEFDKNRSVRADSLFFSEDGTIRKVIPTWRGIGITNAQSKIQIDRYSVISKEGISLSFINILKRNEGWKITLSEKDSWVQYNSVDFGNNKFKSINVRTSSKTGGTLQIRLDKMDGPVIAEVEIPNGDEWDIVNSPLSDYEPGIHNLIVQLKNNNHVEIDWISFK